MAAQRFEFGGGRPRRDDNLAGAYRPAVYDDLRVLLCKANLRDGRSLEDLRPLPGSGADEANAGSIRIETERVAHSHRPRGVEVCGSLDLLLRQPRDVEAGGNACLAFAAKDFLLIAIRRHDHVERLERALDPETTDEGGRLTRTAAPRLEGLACGSQPVRRHDIAKLRPRIGQQESCAATGAAVPDTVPFEEDRTQTGGRTRMRDGAAGQSAADDDDVGRVVTSKPREIRSA